MLLTTYTGVPLRIDEYSTLPVKSRQIHMLIMGNQWARIARFHDFFTMTPTLNGARSKDGIVVDVSSMQYENIVRSHRASLYHDTMTERDDRPEPFGGSFEEHRIALENQGGPQDEEQKTFLLEVELRTMNNAVYREASRLGGRLYLFSMRHKDFLCALDSIGRVLCGALNNLRPRIEPVVFRDSPWAIFQQLIDECEGRGHSVMMEALTQRLNDGM